MDAQHKRFVLLTVRGRELYFEKAKYFRDKWRAPLKEVGDIELTYKNLLAHPPFYKFVRGIIGCVYTHTQKTPLFSCSAFVYFHNRDGNPVIRTDNKEYKGPSEFLEKIDLPSLDYDTLVEDDKFMARVGQITLKHLFDTPMIFEK